jgi:hypothetical protein
VNFIDRNAKNFIFVYFKDFQQWVMSYEEGNPLDMFTVLKEKCISSLSSNNSTTTQRPHNSSSHSDHESAQKGILAFYFRLPYLEPLEENGWFRYDEVHKFIGLSVFLFLLSSHFVSQEREIERLFLQIDDSKRFWKKTYINKNYEVQKLCPYTTQHNTTQHNIYLFVCVHFRSTFHEIEDGLPEM